MANKSQPNRYHKLIEDIFLRHYKRGITEFVFQRTELIETADRLKIELPKNLGDITYSFRFRSAFPDSILSNAPPGQMWVIRAIGRGQYKFVLVRATTISPNRNLIETKIPDATPGIINQYALNDEQAVLAKIRYNRLVDIFTGLTCYSMQNHLRTTVKGIGQVEIDELYVGLDKRGAHYVLPVQAKGPREKFGIVQFEQDIALCKEKFANLICRSIAAQLLSDDRIALIELEQTEDVIAVINERHYRLVPPKDISVEELRIYQSRPE